MKTIKQCKNDELAEEIERCARALIESHHHFVGRARHFEFQCQENVLIVRGSVPTFYLKQVLQSALKGVQGIRLIDNQVTVLSTEWRSGR